MNHRIWWYTFFLFSVIACSVIGCSPRPSSDGATPGKEMGSVDDSDLKPHRLKLKASDNAFHDYTLASNVIYFPDNLLTKITEIISDKQWDQVFVEDLIARNTQAFEHMDHGLAKDACQVPPIMHLDTELPYLRPWRQLVRLRSLRALYLFKQGQEKEAFEDLKAVIAELTTYPAHEEGLANTMRFEYLNVSNFIDDLMKNPSSLSTLVNVFQEITPVPNQKANTFDAMTDLNSVFKPIQTKQLFADNYRKFIADIPRYYKDMTFFRRKVPSFGDNAVGKILYGMMQQSLDNILGIKSRENVHPGAVQLAIALRMYHQDHGTFPEALDALVEGGYMTHIPIDDFDGQPLRYSFEKKLVYSVGKDLTDSGGARPGDISEPSFILVPHSQTRTTVYLKNGRKLQGQMIEETQTHIRLDLGAAKITLKKDGINRIEGPQEGL